MAVQNQTAETANEQKLSRSVDTPEFIVRLAEDMRIRSGSDLPLSCFIEQVRMQLAGKSPGEIASMAADRPARQAPAPRYQSADCFKAWAMPD
ncbi:hypothetical protein HB780_19170 [Rhizobium lusitanum]|uniref:hypothetical protein n=1 Tax=Rhizobium lusitanum TaxID=293958 RepID=UPI0016136654|nr:hypothetical protein [Rhizobium lusitanum]QND47790.1 hypothetical protein HB780_19170 [Rhizobium lusitanum]